MEAKINLVFLLLLFLLRRQLRRRRESLRALFPPLISPPPFSSPFFFSPPSHIQDPPPALPRPQCLEKESPFTHFFNIKNCLCFVSSCRYCNIIFNNTLQETATNSLTPSGGRHPFPLPHKPTWRRHYQVRKQIINRHFPQQQQQQQHIKHYQAASWPPLPPPCRPH